MNDLLKIRKAKKRNFLRQDVHKKPKLKAKWRRPKGHQNKVRLNIQGYRRLISQGFRSPLEVRGLDAKGRKTIIINNLSDLTKIKDESGIISSTVGLKKKKMILAKAKKLNINIANISKIDEAIKKIENMIVDNKKNKEEAEKNKQEKQKSKKPKKDLAETVEEEDKKKKEKQEKDKLLIKGEK